MRARKRTAVVADSPASFQPSKAARRTGRCRGPGSWCHRRRGMTRTRYPADAARPGGPDLAGAGLSLPRRALAPMGGLDRFSEGARRWFTSSFAAPTPAQEQGWEAISRGEDTLILAPTGSGKTLA